MSALPQTYMTVAEYEARESQSPIRHEYLDGRVYAMAGGSNTHARLCTNASGALFNALRGKRCTPVNSEQRVKIEATGLQTYPDASVYCPDARFEGAHDETLLDPQVII